MVAETLAFAATALAIELTPGPNMAYLALIAATEGRRPGLAAVAGVALGLGLMGLAASMGIAVLIAGQPVLYQALRWAGVLYLLWLAWQGWRDSLEEAEHAPLGSTLGLYFRRGLVTNLLNPKAAVFYVTVLPEFLTPTAGLIETLTLSSVYVAVATLVHSAIVLGAGAGRFWLADPVRIRRVRRGLSLALLGVALWVLAKG